MKSGPNQGLHCTGKVFDGKDHCARHRRQLMKGKAPAQPSPPPSVGPLLDEEEPSLSLPGLEPHDVSLASDEGPAPEEFDLEPPSEEPTLETPEDEGPPPPLNLPPLEPRAPIPEGFDSVVFLKPYDEAAAPPAAEEDDGAGCCPPDLDSERTVPPSDDGTGSDEVVAPPRKSREELNAEIAKENMESFRAECELRCLIKDYPELRDLIPQEIFERDVPVQLKLDTVKSILGDQRGLVMATSGLHAVTTVAEGVSAHYGYDITGLADKVSANRECNRLLRLIAMKHEDAFNEMEPELALALAIGGLATQTYGENLRRQQRLEAGLPEDPTPAQLREERREKGGPSFRY